MLTTSAAGAGVCATPASPCPRRGNVRACRCGYTRIVHARGQQGCRFFGGYDWQTDPLGGNGPLDDWPS